MKYHISVKSKDGRSDAFRPKDTFEEAMATVCAYLEDWRSLRLNEPGSVTVELRSDVSA